MLPVPKPDLTGVVVNDQALLQLGKALFWEQQTGSDGQACGSCHFHAGADNRIHNQVDPGLRAVPPDTVFDPPFRPNYTFTSADFPFHVLADPGQNNFNLRVVLRDSNDIASSMGVFGAMFNAVLPPLPIDVGTPVVDPVFNLDTPNSFTFFRNVRRVEPRNTPTMINAVFNHSNFWDGRAHFLFNGATPIGPLDPNAKIWVSTGPGDPTFQQTVRFPSSSLASQAVGPPTSDLEMSFFNRPFPMVGRKLLGVIPLGLQSVDRTDSVLGPLSRSPLPGLKTTYKALIQAAFAPKYWNGDLQFGGAEFTQMEANFSFFWGLAIQRYEQTLVSHSSPVDSFMEGSNSALTQQQLQGLLVFLNTGAKGANPPALNTAIASAQTALGVPIGAGNCISCHAGPAFTEAADLSIELEDTAKLVNGLLAIDTPNGGLLDNGFANIGVRPNNNDLGRGGKENNFPLSFVRQALNPNPNLLQGVPVSLPCNGPGLPPCPGGILVDGAFKVPDLRNAELTGPYFHNGGQATLRQVVEFYDRQSDFADVNIANLDGNIVFINLADVDEDPLVAFLLSLTDERVAQEMAPFDHPSISVPDGGTFPSEQRFTVPAVGAGGRLAKGLPRLDTFLGLSPFTP